MNKRNKKRKRQKKLFGNLFFELKVLVIVLRLSEARKDRERRKKKGKKKKKMKKNEEKKAGSKDDKKDEKKEKKPGAKERRFNSLFFFFVGFFEEKKKKKTEKKNSLSQMWSLAVDLIVRPVRAQYSVAQLGPSEFDIMGFSYRRLDFALKNKRGIDLQCSFYRRVASDNPVPAVIYLHGNSGCRCDADDALHTLLPFGASVFTFDFSGLSKRTVTKL